MPSVLVVDDDRDIRDAVADVLAFAGYAVRTAIHGRDALDQLALLRPDVIVLDLMMPVMDGWHFLRVKRADPALEAIPVLVMSAANEAISGDVPVLLRKPFDFDDLVALVERHCAT